MATTLADAGYTLARMYGYEGSRVDWDESNARRRERAQRMERQAAAVRLRAARRAHGVRKVAPRWQRGARRPRRIEAAMQDPRIRGQLT